MLDFDLRSRIRSGEVTADQKVWHADLEGWMPIGELDLFANEFEITTVTEDNVGDYLEKLAEEDSVVPTSPPPIPVELHIWRRFGARWFDYLAYMAAFFTLVAVADLDLVGLSEKALFPFVLILPWVFLEAASLHFWGTTPGKWLSGLRVRGGNLKNLSAGAAMLRTMRVMILGMGFAQPVLSQICQGLAFWFAKKKKVVLWDTPVGNRLEFVKDVPLKWVAFGLGMALFLLVNLAGLYQFRLSQLSPEQLADHEARKAAIEQILNTPAK